MSSCQAKTDTCSTWRTTAAPLRSETQSSSTLNVPLNYLNTQGYCHTPIPGPTRLADPNRIRGARLRTGTLYLVFFFYRTGTCGYGPHLTTESKYHIKRTTTGVVSIKIYTHLPSPIYKYKTELLHLQIRARNLL